MRVVCALMALPTDLKKENCFYVLQAHYVKYDGEPGTVTDRCRDATPAPAESGYEATYNR